MERLLDEIAGTYCAEIYRIEQVFPLNRDIEVGDESEDDSENTTQNDDELEAEGMEICADFLAHC